MDDQKANSQCAKCHDTGHWYKECPHSEEVAARMRAKNPRRKAHIADHEVGDAEDDDDGDADGHEQFFDDEGHETDPHLSHGPGPHRRCPR